jgi:hypothetical protein
MTTSEIDVDCKSGVAAGGHYVDRFVRQFPMLPSHLWIPVEHAPIEAGQYIVLFECGPQYTVADWWPKDGGFTPDAGDPDLITHWMPLPVSLPNARDHRCSPEASATNTER